ncbi:hypothetical protein ASPWEDRAFT_536476 [Aspergillus wentii DTO 134E9]|uniref:Uncharacterized protein n=1 Tax=Aspergillus wentii DTO 134E9 TaxID=1073089 RepID=A0A1L9RMG3_ASPWE|nr:uncharacterized protein ASPWEDRAFT_536476 [Aspergillus wentii DTO 134E9]KAI9929430.1 hypothetical protein MW887_000900 [Aspergillus wentii]OJJ36126.1 hypothetical protein ASPWEDRAFT_536476 [Aspergillus wentii DTO 134E9]
MPSDGLRPRGLYFMLFIRDSPPPPNDFHWALYFHHDSGNTGMKYHIKGEGGGWIASHEHTAGVLKSFLLVGLLRIADVPVGSEIYLDQAFRTYDNQLNDLPSITCRVWAFWVLELLKKSVKGQRILNCNDLQALEEEVKNRGNSHAMSADRNQQPRPVADSALCGL